MRRQLSSLDATQIRSVIQEYTRRYQADLIQDMREGQAPGTFHSNFVFTYMNGFDRVSANQRVDLIVQAGRERSINQLAEMCGLSNKEERDRATTAYSHESGR